MDILLHGYDVNKPTWLYLSCILSFTLYFRFARLFSLRNLDLLLLLSISPAIMFIILSPKLLMGQIWLIVSTSLVMIRVFFDPYMVRRPKIEPNLNPSAMMFLGICAFVFIAVQAINGPTSATTAAAVREAEQILDGHSGELSKVTTDDEKIQTGPATPLIATTVVTTSKQLVIGEDSKRGADGLNYAGRIAARMISILTHFSIIFALYLISRWHFLDKQLGISMGLLYLILPCTAYNVGELHHVLPTALLLWALVFHKSPLTVGILVGLACSTMFFPLFLIPLFVTFYAKKGWLNYVIGFSSVWLVMLTTMLFLSIDSMTVLRQMLGAIDWSILSFSSPRQDVGVFKFLLHPAYRIPVFTLFILLTINSAVTCYHCSFDKLISQICLIIVGIQFWYPQNGGFYVLWYLPLLLMLVFRPRLLQHNLDERNGNQSISNGNSNSYPLPLTEEIKSSSYFPVVSNSFK